MKKLALLLGCLLCLASCQEKLSGSRGGDARIWLSADINRAPDTKTPYELTTPDTDHPFDASVWASTTSCNFVELSGDAALGGAANTVGYHATVYFQNGLGQLLRGDAQYPEDPLTQVYFIGLHPNAGWSKAAAGSANTSTGYNFLGKEDLMFAPQVSGVRGGANPLLHFFHLLTLLKVEVYAENNDVILSWGKLKSISLADQQKTLSIDLTSVPDISSEIFATRQGNVADKVSFTGATSAMPFYATGTDTAFDYNDENAYTLTTTPTEVAYVLCQPKVGLNDATAGTEGARTDEYVLTLNTQNRSDVSVGIDLKSAADTWFTGSTMGYEFTVTLKLMAGGYIAASATVRDWTTGGYVIQEVEE